MRRALLVLLGVASLVPLGAGGAVLMGLGVVRGLGSVQITATALAVLLLPVAGGWALGGRRAEALGVSLLAWPLALLAGLPGYFPGEVGTALSTGLAALASPFGADTSHDASLVGDRLRAAVDELPQGTPPLPVAQAPAPVCPPPSIVTSGDQVALPYEGQGHSLAIPVEFGEVEVPMLFDTGASLTTLNSTTLRRLGVRVPRSAPEVTLRTANGPRTARLVLIDQVWIAGFGVQGVTVGVCEECADEHVAGLLGLNVSGQFLVTLDTARREVVLEERGIPTDRLLDVGPWLDVEASAAVFPDQRVEVTVTGTNRANRLVKRATVGVTCGEDRYTVELADIPPFTATTTLSALPRGTVCDTYRVSLDGATW